MRISGPVGRNSGPSRRPGCRAGNRVHPVVDGGDQPQLPRPPLDLPHAERDERRRQRQQQRGQEAARDARGAGYGRPNASGDIGIMLLLRWYMTQVDPPIVIATTTTVKMNDTIVQPPSARESRWRK